MYEVLKCGDIINEGPIPSQLSHAHETTVAWIKLGETTVKCLKKTGAPHKTFTPAWEKEVFDPMYANVNYVKEETVYLIGKALEFPEFPVSVWRPDLGCSLQVYIEGITLEEKYSRRQGIKKTSHLKSEGAARIALVDFLVNQKDRSWKNLYLSGDKILYAIDNEASFEPSHVGLDYVFQLIDSRCVKYWTYHYSDVIQKLVDRVLENKIDELRDIVRCALASHPIPRDYVSFLLGEMDIRIYLLKNYKFNQAVLAWYSYALSQVPYKKGYCRSI